MNSILKRLKHLAYVGVYPVLTSLLDLYERAILASYSPARKLEKLPYLLLKFLSWQLNCITKKRIQLYGLTMKNREPKICLDATKQAWGLDLSSSLATLKATTKSSSKQMEVG